MLEDKKYVGFSGQPIKIIPRLLTGMSDSKKVDSKRRIMSLREIVRFMESEESFYRAESPFDIIDVPYNPNEDHVFTSDLLLLEPRGRVLLFNRYVFTQLNNYLIEFFSNIDRSDVVSKYYLRLPNDIADKMKKEPHIVLEENMKERTLLEFLIEDSRLIDAFYKQVKRTSEGKLELYFPLYQNFNGEHNIIEPLSVGFSECVYFSGEMITGENRFTIGIKY